MPTIYQVVLKWGIFWQVWVIYVTVVSLLPPAMKFFKGQPKPSGQHSSTSDLVLYFDTANIQFLPYSICNWLFSWLDTGRVQHIKSFQTTSSVTYFYSIKMELMNINIPSIWEKQFCKACHIDLFTWKSKKMKWKAIQRMNWTVFLMLIEHNKWILETVRLEMST